MARRARSSASCFFGSSSVTMTVGSQAPGLGGAGVTSSVRAGARPVCVGDAKGMGARKGIDFEPKEPVRRLARFEVCGGSSWSTAAMRANGSSFMFDSSRLLAMISPGAYDSTRYANVGGFARAESPGNRALGGGCWIATDRFAGSRARGPIHHPTERPSNLGRRPQRLGYKEVVSRSWLVATFLTVASCRSCDGAPRAGEPEIARGESTSSAPRAGASASADAWTRRDPAAASPDAARPDERAEDGGASSCRIAYGPAEQPFRGPAALSIDGQRLRVIVNDAGRPRVLTASIPATPRAPLPVVTPGPAPVAQMRWPPCELAGRFVYCQAADGYVHRATLDDGARGVRRIAKSRPGTRIAAASLGAEHSIVAFLDVRRTTEGDVLQAFVALDDREPVRLSEDGAGATTLRLLGRGESAVAVYLDARTAMVPVHARPVTMRGSDLALGPDAVIFVGGAPERGIDLTVAAAGPKGFAFLPLPRTVTDFAMATLVIEDPPKDDVAAVWSPYPGGLDPAPIAATAARDGQSAWVARVRPRRAEPGASRVVELGRVDLAGLFTSLGEIASGEGVTDLALIDDGTGVWVFYGGATTSRLERRICR